MNTGYLSTSQKIQEILAGRVRPWAERNTKDGYAHLNQVQYAVWVASRNWPELGRALLEATKAVRSEAATVEDVNRFEMAWRAVCREVRRFRASAG